MSTSEAVANGRKGVDLLTEFVRGMIEADPDKAWVYHEAVTRINDLDGIVCAEEDILEHPESSSLERLSRVQTSKGTWTHRNPDIVDAIAKSAYASIKAATALKG